MLKCILDFEMLHTGVGVEPDLLPYDSAIIAEYEDVCA